MGGLVPFVTVTKTHVRTIVPGSPEGVINTHNATKLYYEDGSYVINVEIVFNFKQES